MKKLNLCRSQQLSKGALLTTARQVVSCMLQSFLLQETANDIKLKRVTFGPKTILHLALKIRIQKPLPGITHKPCSPYPYHSDYVSVTT